MAETDELRKEIELLKQEIEAIKKLIGL